MSIVRPSQGILRVARQAMFSRSCGLLSPFDLLRLFLLRDALIDTLAYHNAPV